MLSALFVVSWWRREMGCGLDSIALAAARGHVPKVALELWRFAMILSLSGRGFHGRENGNFVMCLCSRCPSHCEREANAGGEGYHRARNVFIPLCSDSMVTKQTAGLQPCSRTAARSPLRCVCPLWHHDARRQGPRKNRTMPMPLLRH